MLLPTALLDFMSMLTDWLGEQRVYNRSRSAALLLLALLAAGCSSDASDDTLGADQEEFQGLSREQIETEFEPMSLEQAESLGIVDTTISIVPPIDPDSVEALGLPPIGPADTLTP